MISKKSYGVDVAKYQSKSLRAYAKAGAKYAIVQVSVSNSIVAPKAKAQITSAKANNITPMGYFYGCFGHSATQAASEANFAINNAKSMGLPKGSYLGVDWERIDNNVNGNVSQNTAAIIQAMKVIRDAGYIPLLYSGADLLRNKINTKQVIKEFGACLWVASYPVSSRVNTANFNYFPSMDGVAIWQFCDNWKGLGVDGNISLIDLHKETATTHKAAKPVEKPKSKPEKKTGVVYAPVINHNPKWMIQLMDSAGHYTGKYIKTNTRWKYFDVKSIKGIKCYKLGTDKQYVPAKFLKVIE